MKEKRAQGQQLSLDLIQRGIPEPKVNDPRIPAIEKKFNYRHFLYKQVLREKNIAIYEQWLKSQFVASRMKTDPPEGDIFIGYEVVKIKKRRAEIMFGKEIPAREAYPGSEQWGIHGWTCKDWQSAKNKFAELLGTHKGERKVPKFNVHVVRTATFSKKRIRVPWKKT
jgi:hypothetical protein